MPSVRAALLNSSVIIFTADRKQIPCLYQYDALSIGNKSVTHDYYVGS